MFSSESVPSPRSGAKNIKVLKKLITANASVILPFRNIPGLLPLLNFKIQIKAQGLDPYLILKQLKDRSISDFGLSPGRGGLGKPYTTQAAET